MVSFKQIAKVSLVSVILGGCASSPKLTETLKTLGNNNTSNNDDNNTSNNSGLRVYEFAANTQELRPVVKVVLVVDNSNSMQDEQENLSQGVTQMLADLQSLDMDTDFYVYSTTEEALSDVSRNPVSQTSVSYTFQDGTGNEISRSRAPSTSEANFYDGITKWNLRPAMGANHKFSFTRGMKKEDFELLGDSLVSTIRSIGTNGSDNEAGLCTVGRILAEPVAAPNHIFNPGDKAAFVIISDADDNSTGSACVSETKQRMDYRGPQPTNIGISNHADVDATSWVYYPLLQKKVARTAYLVGFKYTETCIVDGQQRPCAPKDHSVQFTPPAGTPTSATWIPCTTAVLNYAQNSIVGASKPIVTGSCNYVSYEVKDQVYCPTFVDNIPSRDLCTTAFTRNGTDYANVLDYCQKTNPTYDATYCYNYGVKPALTSPTFVAGAASRRTIQSVLSSDAASLSDAISAKATEMFGNRGFFFSAIIDDSDLDRTGCTGPSEGFGKKYRSFVDSLNSQGSINPICASSYFPALQKIKDFIVRSIGSSYSLSLEAGEKIESIVLKRIGAQINLIEGQDYQITAGVIDFAEGFLRESDSLKVTIKKN